MGLFNKFKEGGIMDTIKCEEQDDFLIWKWRPNAEAGPNESRKETSIRNGSSLIVRRGQVCVFQYAGGGFDLKVGPLTERISTDNMPVLAGLVGTLFAGGTPYPAEIYFINVQTSLSVPFFVEKVRLVPPPEMNMPNATLNVAVKGLFNFEISKDQEGIEHLLDAFGGVDTPMYVLEDRVRQVIPESVGSIVARVPKAMGIGLLDMDSSKSDIGTYITSIIKDPKTNNNLEHRLGVKILGVNITEVIYDEDSDAYLMLKEYALMQHNSNKMSFQYGQEQQKTAIYGAQKQREMLDADVTARNATVLGTAGIQMEHMQDQLARMREEGQFAQHSQTIEASRQARLGTESAFINAHALDQQTEVMKTGLENMGSMGAMNLGGGDGHMNPAGIMTGMMMGSAVAGQMGQMMGQMGGMMQQNMAQAGQPQQAPPPIPGQQTQAVAYYLNVNNQQYGPVGIQGIAQMVQAGQVTGDTLAWCEGMSAWAPAKTIPALQALFAPAPGSVPPPIPPVPPVPPVPPTV